MKSHQKNNQKTESTTSRPQALQKRYIATFAKMSVVSVLLGVIACSPQVNKTSQMLGGETSGLFSNRQIQQDEFVAIIKLQQPPLLASATLGASGKREIPSEMIKSIEAEQEQAIKDLKDLSSDIRVIYRYKMILNGFAIVAPIEVKDKLKSRLHVAYAESQGQFARPVTFQNNLSDVKSLLQNGNSTSVEFIGSNAAYQKGIKGQNIKVGIIDTGIDFTHSMLGGSGAEGAYKAIDPSKVSSEFPNKKVVGGIDLVGTEFDSGSSDYKKHLPIPDENPLDEGGHGSHVAGTVAGIGDGVLTYSGVAPEASLYAIKVFGAHGSTGDAVVIAGLEYAADPNKDGVLDDQLDVVNMSLGSSYGTPHILYEQAIGNLVRGGTVVVASAGNSGPNDYIVGAPSVVEEAISVAASVDDMPHNWKFDSVKFQAGEETFLAEAIQGSISKPVQEVGDLKGNLVYVGGTAASDFTPEIAAAVKGQVALIDRGAVTFSEKVKRAFDAGAIGVIVANNQPSAPISMGGDGKFDIPAIMITQALGVTLKNKLSQNISVVVGFKSDLKVEKPELIDTLTGFSSKGPRSLDGLLKPEISAPGANIISAEMGGGQKGIQMSGTSMAGPHIAGVMALVKQAYPTLSPLELKSILMGHGKTITDEKKQNYLLSRQGAGRVQVDKLLGAVLVGRESAISLGELNIETQKVIPQNLSFKNISKMPLDVRLAFEGSPALSLTSSSNGVINAGESLEFPVQFKINVSLVKPEVEELDGFVNVIALGKIVHRIPVLAVVKRVAKVKADSVKVFADSKASAENAMVKMSIVNRGVNKGLAIPFNLIAKDERKQDSKNDPYMSRFCDLQAVGYRIIEKNAGQEKIKVLQVGIKTYDSMTTWNTCEVSVQFDANGDQQADQELGAIQLGNVKGISTPANEQSFASVLFDAVKMRQIRLQFEQDSLVPSQKKPEENYAPAVIDMLALEPFRRSSVIIVEADVTKLVKRADGTFGIKVATQFSDLSSVEMDDFLGKQATEWATISSQEDSQSFKKLPEFIELMPNESRMVEFVKGQGNKDLLLLFPDNKTTNSDSLLDSQLQVMSPKFGL